ncbi:hypothetical protein MMC25_003833 [Agyrium rufum]|nr:hypothetical protein [Agyrium rufum]
MGKSKRKARLGENGSSSKAHSHMHGHGKGRSGSSSKSNGVGPTHYGKGTRISSMKTQRATSSKVLAKGRNAQGTTAMGSLKGAAAAAAGYKGVMGTNGQGVQLQSQRRARVPFSRRHRILCVGEGDFSFAHALLSSHHGCSHITATSYDSREEVLRKYPSAWGHIEALEKAGQVVLFGVDAGRLSEGGQRGGLGRLRRGEGRRGVRMGVGMGIEIGPEVEVGGTGEKGWIKGRWAVVGEGDVEGEGSENGEEDGDEVDGEDVEDDGVGEALREDGEDDGAAEGSGSHSDDDESGSINKMSDRETRTSDDAVVDQISNHSDDSFGRDGPATPISSVSPDGSCQQAPKRTSIHLNQTSSAPKKKRRKMNTLQNTKLEYDRIIFNFPHTGGLTKDVDRQVRANQALLVSFFTSAIPLLATPSPGSLTPYSSYRDLPGSDNPNAVAVGRDRLGNTTTTAGTKQNRPGGKILVALFTSAPYDRWNIRDLGRHAGLKVVRSEKVDWDAWSGGGIYRHRRTVGEIKKRSGEDGEGGWRGEEREARWYAFGRVGDAAGDGGDRRDGDDVFESEDDRGDDDRGDDDREDEDEEGDESGEESGHGGGYINGATRVRSRKRKRRKDEDSDSSGSDA